MTTAERAFTTCTWKLFAVLVTGVMTAGSARAMCDVIPQPDREFRGALGQLNRVFVGAGDPLSITIDTQGCEAGSTFIGSQPSTIASGFDSDLDGWNLSGFQTLVQVGSGGNPGGYAEGTNLWEVPGFWGSLAASAAVGWFGDWIASGVTEISWDHQIVSLCGGNRLTAPIPLVEISGFDGFTSGVARYEPTQAEIDAVPIGSWGSWSLPIAPGPTPPPGWSIVSGTLTWDQILSSVVGVKIQGELGDANCDVYGIDNLTLHDVDPVASVATFVFEPPSGNANAVVVTPTTGGCAAMAGEISACQGELGGGLASCIEDPSLTLTPDRLSLAFPTTALAGPVTVAVTPESQPLPCELASSRCADLGAGAGLVACVDQLYSRDGTCETGSVNRHPDFPGLTSMPAANDFQDICTATHPSVTCNASGADVLFTTDAAGNVLVPIDWRGVLVEPRTLPIPRLVKATTSIAAFTGTPPEANQTPGAPMEIPGPGFLQSFSRKGLRVHPLFNPLADAESFDTTLFGSTDAEIGVLRVLRRSPAFRQCDGGTRGGLACIGDFECPASTCGQARCRGGANANQPCSSDTGCPGGECGPSLHDFGDRYSLGGVGAVVLTSAEYTAEAENPAAIDGLVSNDDLFMFVRSEALDGEDLNADGDQDDGTVVTLRDAGTGDPAPVAGVAGRAGLRVRTRGFRLPAIATEDDFVAFLESEPDEALDANADGDTFDAILRIFQLDPAGSSTDDLTATLDLAVDGEDVIDGAGVAMSDGLVFFRRSEQEATSRTSASLLGFAPDLGGMAGELSATGRFVVFTAFATNVVPGDTNGTADVFVRDRDTDADGIFDEPGATSIVRVSVTSTGAQGTCTFCPAGPFSQSISDDGRWVAMTTGLELDPADTGATSDDVYVHDRDADEDGIFDEPGAIATIPLSVDGAGVFQGGLTVEMSSSGRFVSFTSFGGLVPSDTDGQPDLYLVDRDADEDGIFDETGATSVELIADVDLAGFYPAPISDGGRYVALTSRTGHVPGDTNGENDVYVLDRDVDEDGILGEPGQTAFLPASLDRQGNFLGDSAINVGNDLQMSRDARFLAYGNGGTGNPYLLYDRDVDEDRVFDEPGAVELRGLPGFSIRLSPSGRFLATGSGFGADVDHGRLDDETDLSETLATVDVAAATVSISSGGRFSLVSDANLDLRMVGPDTADLSQDLNLDGDTEDAILAVADARSGTPPTLALLGPAERVATSDGNAAFLRPEASDGTGLDLNGDFDTQDRVVQLWRNPRPLGLGAAPPAVNLGLAAEDVAISDQIVAALASEADEGVSLNGDADLDDLVVHLNDTATGTSGTWQSLALAADAVQAVGGYVAFTVPEADQGSSLNGDADQLDRVLHVYDASGQPVAFLDELGAPRDKPAVDDFLLGEQAIAFRVNEADEGQNLNGIAPPIPGGVADTDMDDSVLHVMVLATGRTYNGMQAAIPCPVEACDPRLPYRLVGTKATFLTLEAEQGGNDLDQSGGFPNLVIQHFNPDALAAGGGMADACDIVGGAVAGICTGTAAGCAMSADCAGGGECYFPPGGCLADSGTSCDFETGSPCTGDQFCAPVLGSPGTFTCQEITGPCLTNAECAPGDVCVDDGANAEQVFASIGEEVDGRQRYVSRGRCSDGDGSCDNDDQCNEGATCDLDVAVIANAADTDADGLADPIDNCPTRANGDQRDTDGDGIGDACDRQTCGDGSQTYGETCDDGNLTPGDGCDDACQLEGATPACSNGLDDDGDGDVDFAGGDVGCTDALDGSERQAGIPCDDGIDGDGDYGIDYVPDADGDGIGEGDPACKRPSWPTETPECQDGLNNDGGQDPSPGLVDWDGGVSVHGPCVAGSCPPGVSDPDGDGVPDPDPECTKPWRGLERKQTGSCGLGFELAFLLPLLAALRGRRMGRKCWMG